MLNSKFLDYALRMDKYELNRFSRYLHSPLYNEDEKLMLFAAKVLPAIKTNTTLLTEKEIWQGVFDKKVFNKGKYNRLLSDAVKKLEHFLVIDRFHQQKSLQYALQLEIMNERKLYKHIPEQLSYAEKKHYSALNRDAAFYYDDFLLQQQKNLWLESRDQRNVEKNLGEVLNSLDVFYFTNKLKYCAALLHYKNFLAIEADVALVPEVMQQLEKQNPNIPAIEIYRQIILSFTAEKSDVHFHTLKKLIIANNHLFKLDEVKNMFVFAMNYCINQINFGRSEYLSQVLDLYKLALQNDLLLDDEYISQWDYKNIVTTALRVKDFKWAEKFIEEYRNKLPKADRQNAYSFNRARYFFAVKNYDKVLQLLQSVQYNDIFYQLDSKTTLLKTYYELDEWQPLYSLKDSFRVLLRRKKLITPRQKENYMNLIKFTIKLFNAEVKNKSSMATLSKLIKTTANIADKSWLLEKLGELGY